MNCKEATNQLSAYADGALSAHVAWDVERHLAQCLECSAEANNLHRLIAALAEAPKSEAPAGFAHSVQMRIRETQSKRQSQGIAAWLSQLMRPRLAPAIGAAGVLAVLTVSVLNPGRQPQGPALLRVENPVLPTGEANQPSLAVAAGDPFEDISAAHLAGAGSGLRGAN